MDDLCRFCGTDLVNKPKCSISNNEKIKHFYRSLPLDVQADDDKLPKSYCYICDAKISNFVDFFNVVLATDRLLKNMLTPPTLPKNNITRRPSTAKHLRLRRISELVEKPNLKFPDNLVTIKSEPEEIETSSRRSSNLTEIEDDKFIKDEKKNDGFRLEDRKETKVEETKTIKNISVISLEKVQPNFVCDRCNGKFPTLKMLNHHLQTNNECKYTDIICGKCNKLFKTRNIYLMHICQVHEKMNQSSEIDWNNCKIAVPDKRKFETQREMCIGISIEDSDCLVKSKYFSTDFEPQIDHLEIDYKENKKVTSKQKIYSCAAYRCGRKRIRGITLHSLPKDHNLRTKWANLLKIQKNVVLTKNLFVCNLHFSENDYFPRTPNIFSSRRLKYGVIPSKNLPTFP